MGCFVSYMGRLCIARVVDPAGLPQPHGTLAEAAADGIMRATGPLAALLAASGAGPLVSPNLARAFRAGEMPAGVRQAGMAQIGSLFGQGVEGRGAVAGIVRVGFERLRAEVAAASPRKLVVMEDARLWAAARDGLSLAALLAVPGSGALALRGGYRVAAFPFRPPVCGVPGVVCSGEPFRPGVVGVTAEVSDKGAAEMVRAALDCGARSWAAGGPSRYAAAMAAVLSARPERIGVCETCGAVQIARLSSPRAKYCSDACRARKRRDVRRGESREKGVCNGFAAVC